MMIFLVDENASSEMIDLIKAEMNMEFSFGKAGDEVWLIAISAESPWILEHGTVGIAELM